MFIVRKLKSRVHLKTRWIREDEPIFDGSKIKTAQRGKPQTKKTFLIIYFKTNIFMFIRVKAIN